MAVLPGTLSHRKGLWDVRAEKCIYFKYIFSIIRARVVLHKARPQETPGFSCDQDGLLTPLLLSPTGFPPPSPGGRETTVTADFPLCQPPASTAPSCCR